MGFEISSSRDVQAAVNYSVDKVRTPKSPKAEETEPQESSKVLVHNYSVTSAEDNCLENKQSENKDSEQGKEPTEKEVKSKIDQANKELRHAKTGLDFKYHEATKRVSITVYDKDTREVIREIPPEKSLDMLEKMWELAGMVIDDRR